MSWLDEMEAADPAYPDDVPVPYTLTDRADALLDVGNGRPHNAARGWVLTPKAEALLAAPETRPAAGPSPEPEAEA